VRVSRRFLGAGICLCCVVCIGLVGVGCIVCGGLLGEA
jgi:hypothetical protein